MVLWMVATPSEWLDTLPQVDLCINLNRVYRSDGQDVPKVRFISFHVYASLPDIRKRRKR